jgi:lysophospholipid acyltransferase (LPLAT)-like uncharacterized protein
LKHKMVFWLFTVICRLLRATYRFQEPCTDNKNLAKSMHPKGSFVIASWHQNCFAGILAHAKQKICLLVSPSFDGDLVGALARKLKIDTVRGSSSRGGRAALEQLVKLTDQGSSAAFTIDGPRGPLYSVKKGVFELAARTHAPILPLLTVADKYWVLHRSWDKFRIPKPFAKVYVIYGKPFHVDSNNWRDQLEGLSASLAADLFALEQQAFAHGYVRQGQGFGALHHPKANAVKLDSPAS